MKIEIQTTKDKIGLTNYMKNEHVILEVNENNDNIYIEFDSDDERDRFIEKLNIGLICKKCNDTINVDEDIYCKTCYDWLDDKCDVLEEERDKLLDKVERLEKEIFDNERLGKEF
jgi:hypothetical protein